VIDGVYGTGIVQKSAYSSAPEGSGYVITVRNNIITNTRTSAGVGNGSGICNLLADTHSFVLQNNCFYNNTGGNYVDVQASPSDIAADPQYADRDKHDYHLKSNAGRWNGSCWVNDNISSPCIDAGDPSSDYSNEPESNGNRINIGPDGIQGMPQNQNLIYQTVALAVTVVVTVVVEAATVAAVAVVGEVAEVAPRNLQQMLK
jgi:Disaggregatase related